MEVKVVDINNLRQKTGAGMMDCKKALVESEGNFNDAVDILRKKGQKVSELRAGKQANEGVVIAKNSKDNKLGIIITLNCETDFVAKNKSFIDFAQSIADTALLHTPSSLEDLLNLKIDNTLVSDKIIEQVTKIGEKLELTSFDKLKANYIVSYNHIGYKIGVLTAFNKQCDTIDKDLAMQVAAMNPVAIDKDDVEQSVVDKELEIAKEQLKTEGKPENIIEKIVAGKLNKFYKENTLLNQEFVKDTSKTVRQIIEEVDKDLKIEVFKRVALKQ